MHVNHEMIQAGIKRATELGILPRKDLPEDIATNAELMEEILRAALRSGAHASFDSSPDEGYEE